MRAFVNAIETVSRTCGYAAALLVTVLIAVMVYEVVMRYVFSAPTAWSYDISSMTLGAIFVLSIAYTAATDAHVRIDLLHRPMGRLSRPIIDLAGNTLVMLPLVAWLTWGLWEHFHASLLSLERTGASAWNPLIWPFRLVMFVGAAAWLLQVVAEIAKSLILIGGRSVATDPPPSSA